MPLWAVVRCAKAGTLRRQAAAIGGMNMANRNDSEVHQHETLPGPGPGPSSYTETATGGGRPVEQMMDAAIERIAREQRGLATASAFDMGVLDRGVFDAAIEKPAKPTRLRWKGLDVSEEFRSYAERVARGEQLPPFEGRVLAEPNAAFPWGPLDSSMHSMHSMHTVKAASRAARTALWCSAAVVLGLLTWSVALEFQASRERALLPPMAASDDIVSEAAVPHDVVETPARLAPTTIDERVAERLALEAAAVEKAPAKPLELPPANVTPPPAAAVPAAVAPAAVATSVATSVAPLAAPAFEAPVVAPSAPVAPVPAASTQPAAAPAAVQKPAAVTVPAAAAPATAPEVDFGIDAVSASSGSSASAPLKSSVTMTGSVGDLARSGQVPGASVRKEPGSESSAKGSLLVENPSF